MCVEFADATRMPHSFVFFRVALSLIALHCSDVAVVMCPASAASLYHTGGNMRIHKSFDCLEYVMHAFALDILRPQNFKVCYVICLVLAPAE